MSAPGRRGASIFTQGPAPAGSARGAPIPANEDDRRRFPTWSLCPQLRLHEGQAEAIIPSGPTPSLPPVRGPRTSRPGRVPGAPPPRSGRGPSPSQAARELPDRVCQPAGARGRQDTSGGRPRSLLSAAPGTYFLARACVLLPGSRRPLQVPRRHRRRLPQHRTSSRGRLRRVPSPPPPPHHVPHPGLRHRETRSRPAWVGRPEARPSAPAAGPECRPEACSGHDTLPAGPPRPLAWRVPPGPGSSPHPRVLGTPPVHSWADAPRLNRPLLCQRHSNILRV
ncbi:proline-rich protein 2-like [Bos indicus]|uniref:Proline-rich protein 2-like n=1 Tax=Bos indicus TaxID=9915 RepID=A0ABM4T0B3_BOSIN